MLTLIGAQKLYFAISGIKILVEVKNTSMGENENV